MREGLLPVFLCGDVMLGRGIDQILAHPGFPEVREESVRDARTYVRLAEEVHGRIPRPVPPAWPWGDALAVLDDAAPAARIVNLETSVTRSADFAPGKEVCYRMSPANLPCLEAVRPDVCVLANNHVLDFGVRGLTETLRVLSGAGLRTAGAGADLAAARRPAIVPVDDDHRVLVLAVGAASSGIPPSWSAAQRRPGVRLLPSLSPATADDVALQARQLRRPGDVVIVSVHWGSNWGYAATDEQVRFAHRLIEGGVDVVHGHSSHHPRPIEVYRDRLVLYGCGDFVDDYEGIGGYEEYRPELRIAYVAGLAPESGRLVELRMTVLRAHQMRLQRAPDEDVAWLRAQLDGRRGTAVVPGADGGLVVRPTPLRRNPVAPD
ncbi:MAG TPA: CapA family protein [Blastococcus sp.]|nr:CapA family protein [Blastococcus sp.]